MVSPLLPNFKGQKNDSASPVTSLCLSGYEPTSFCPDGVPLEFALLSLLAAFGAAFGILYVALTQAGGGRRKRRAEGSFLLLNTELADLLWTGRQNSRSLPH